MTKKAKIRRSFTDEFKDKIVQLLLNGKKKSKITMEYDILKQAALILGQKWI